jgi:CheY-like chemotaxis protein
MMPQMSGLEVLQRVKASPATAHIPVIMVTAKMQDEDVLIGYQLRRPYYIHHQTVHGEAAPLRHLARARPN